MKKQTLLLAGLFMAAMANATIYYVKPDASSEAWAHCPADKVYTDIATPYAYTGAGDEVWVAEGTYAFSAVLNLRHGASLYGGFSGTETSIEGRERVEGGQPWEFVHETIIQKEESLTASNLINQTVYMGTPVIIDGFTFEKSIGSAVTIRRGTTVQNCIFRDNISTWGGGGVQMYLGGRVQYCYFYNNESRSDDKNGGAALYATSNTLEDMNYVENCVFENNRGLAWDSARGGGALRANAAVTVANCVFYNNTAGNETDGWGKGAAIFVGYPSNTIVNCLIYNNSGFPVFFNKGGTMINSTICNNFTGGTSSYSLYIAGADGTNIYNTAIWNNQNSDGNQAYVYAVGSSNTIVFDHVAMNRGLDNIKCTVADQTWENVFALSDDNRGSATDHNYPDFAKPTSFIGVTADEAQIAELKAADWHTSNHSFLVDKGDNDLVSIEYDMDLDGITRPLTEENPADIGVYETKYEEPVTIYYVKPDEASEAWAHCPADKVFTDIATAYALTQPGNEVWVAEGTYPIAAMLMLREGASLYGGFSGTETSIEEREMISGGQVWDFVHETIIQKEESLTASNLINQSAYMNTPVIVDGFTFEKSIGSAVTIRRGTTVQKCIFRDNISTWGGGGVQMYLGGRVQYCYFYNNESRSDDRNGGAALYASSNTLDDMNYVENCVFENNRGLAWDSARGGGALRANAAVTVANCVFYNNTAGNETDGWGKGGAIFSAWPSNTFINCLIYNNSGFPVFFNKGGTMINSTICNNLTGGTSSYSLYIAGADGTNIYNTAIWNNKDTNGEQAYIYAAGASSAIVFDHVAMNRGTDNIKCTVADQTWENVFTLSDDNAGTTENENYPYFTLPTSFVGTTADETEIDELKAADWHTENSSFLIDQGSNELASAVYNTDLDGITRPLTEDNPADLGVYETQKMAPVSISAISEGNADIYAYNGQLHVDAPNSRVYVYDFSGRIVSSFQTGNAPASINLANGIYIIRIENQNQLTTQKIML